MLPDLMMLCVAINALQLVTIYSKTEGIRKLKVLDGVMRKRKSNGKNKPIYERMSYMNLKEY